MAFLPPVFPLSITVGVSVIGPLERVHLGVTFFGGEGSGSESLTTLIETSELENSGEAEVSLSEAVEETGVLGSERGEQSLVLSNTIGTS